MSEQNQFTFKSIGVVHSCYKDKFGTPRQSGIAKEASGQIEIFPQVQPELSLDALQGFSHIWLIFVFHKNQLDRFHAKVHPPRLKGKTVGVFASRTPHRPNEIGLSLVEIEKIEGNMIFVKGLDLIDGTPILDVKPYLPEVESLPHAKSGWLKHVEDSPLKISWSSDAEEFLKKIEAPPAIYQTIEDSLKQDPRPLVYKEHNKDSYRTAHVFRVYDFDVHFTYPSETEILITHIVHITP